jgi:hypothetical protein
MANALQARLIVNIETPGAGPTPPAKLRVQYSTDQSLWSYLGVSSGPSVDINTTGLKVSGWMDLAPGAKAENVFLRLVGLDGNWPAAGSSAADPAFGLVLVQFR